MGIIKGKILWSPFSDLDMSQSPSSDITNSQISISRPVDLGPGSIGKYFKVHMGMDILRDFMN